MDLIYLDPPFNANAAFGVLFDPPEEPEKSEEAEAFRDMWTWKSADQERLESILAEATPLARALDAFERLLGPSGLLSYLLYLGERLALLERVLKPGGALYLHCDSVAAHYLKLLLDRLFGPSQFANDIFWRRDAAGKGGKKKSHQWPRNADTILFYRKSAKKARPYFEQQYKPLTPKQEKTYIHTDPDGRRYKSQPRGHYTAKSIAEFEAQGRIHTSSSGKIYVKQYLDGAKATIDNIWDDIPGFGIRTNAAERLGYPTQKPLALLERILAASCPEGGTVLDPFAGCGTSCEAAENLNRHWIGMDIAYLALDLLIERFTRRGDDSVNAIEIFETPKNFTDAEALHQSTLDALRLGERPLPQSLEEAEAFAQRQGQQGEKHGKNAGRFEFQRWACSLVQARPAEREIGDGGVDGRIFLPGRRPSDKPRTCLLEVKSRRVGIADLDRLRGVIGREKASAGMLLTLYEPLRNVSLLEACRSAGHFEGHDGTLYPRLQICSVQRYFELHQHDANVRPWQLPTPYRPFSPDLRRRDAQQQSLAPSWV